MNPEVRYQVFVSSTYEDLREERQQATQAILETGCFPSGMELFPASDETQWDLIKRVIEESDYYILIIAGRYGSVGPHGASYTEMEYDYAVEKGIPILGFVRDDISKITVNNSETSEFGREKTYLFPPESHVSNLPQVLIASRTRHGGYEKSNGRSSRSPENRVGTRGSSALGRRRPTRAQTRR